LKNLCLLEVFYYL